MKKTMAWTILYPVQDEPGTFVWRTRDEAIRHECWNLLEVVGPPGNYPRPWNRVDSKEISKAWRRLKRRRGCRAVRVLIEVHPKYLEEER